MPFLDFDAFDKQPITPQHSSAYGELVTGDAVEMGRLSFKEGEGAEPHAHPQEQMIYVLTGRLLVTLDGVTSEVGPGSGFHAPSNVPHGVRALEDTQLLSCKEVRGGVGHEL